MPQRIEDLYSHAVSKAQLEREYGELVENGLLQWPIELNYGETDLEGHARLASTVEAMDRLKTWREGRNLSPSDARRAAVAFEEGTRLVREQPGPPGTILSKEALDDYERRRRKSIADGGEFGVSVNVRNFGQLVESDVRRLALRLPCPVFVGEYPNGEFNAWGVPSRSGVLLMVNRGLFSLIHQMALVYVLFQKMTEDHMSMSVNRTDHTLVLPEDSPFPKNEIVDCSIELLVSYSRTREGRSRKLAPMIGGWRGVLMEILVEQTYKFVLSHEYGHVVAGHLGPTDNPTKPEASDKRQAIRFSRKQEFEADGIANALMFCADETWQKIGGGDLGKEQAVIGGPAFFFSLATLFETFDEGLRGVKPSPDHPLPSERWSRMRDLYSERLGPGALQMADTFDAWASVLVNEIGIRFSDPKFGVFVVDHR